MTLTDRIVAKYRSSESKSAQLHQRALTVMPGGNTRTTVHLDPYPPYLVAGSGMRVTDAEVEERLDFLNNYTSLIHGHADPDVVVAVNQQMVHGSAFGLPTAREIELAELIVDRIPSIAQVRFTNSGTEAVMIALQAARAYTGRPMIAKFEGSYHGTYDFAAVSTTVPPGASTDGVATIAYADGTPDAVLDQVVVLRYNDLDMMERVLEAQRDRVAAVLIDLMPWRMGLMEVDKEFLSRLREITREYGIVLIFDEVITLRVGYGGGGAGIHRDLS